jgi:sirohydrochlorin ferrochelatase
MTLTLLAHGSPDPRHARDVASLSGRLTVAGMRSRAAYLDHDRPSPAAVARGLAGEGATATTVVPLLLAPAHHVRMGVPAAVSAMRSAAPTLAVAAAAPVGLHPLVLDAAVELVRDSDLTMGPRTGIILAGTGSRDARAVAAVEALVDEHGRRMVEALGVRAVRAAHLDGGRPIGRIRTLMRCIDGCTSFLVVTLVVADGILRDRIVAAAGRMDLPVVPGTLAATNALADLVVLRAGTAPAPDTAAATAAGATAAPVRSRR